jgi:hypothetical protein
LLAQAQAVDFILLLAAVAVAVVVLSEYKAHKLFIYLPQHTQLTLALAVHQQLAD